MAATLPLGFQPDIIVLNCDDAPLDWFSTQSMPLFMANWASSTLNYEPNSSANAPLCLPGRIAVLSGQRMEHHHGWDNSSGANLRLNETFLVALQRIGYRTGAVGKWINGFGESGNGGFGTQTRQPGLDYQRIMWGPPDYFNYDILNEAGGLTHYGDSTANGGSDTNYAVDVELVNAQAFINSTPTNRPYVLYWASKAPHKDGGGAGGPTPAPRFASASVTLTPNPSFGLDPAAYGNPPWMSVSAESPWDAAAILAANNEHIAAMRTIRALDEALHTVLTALQASGRLSRTVIFLTTDNAHAYGEMRQLDKGTCHRGSSGKLLRVIVPGQAGGMRYQAVSDIDIAPTICHLAGTGMPVAPDGMSMVPTFSDANYPFRQAAPIGSLVKDSPTAAGLWFGPESGRPNGGRVYYEGLPGGKAAGQQGCWTDYDQITDQGPQPDAALALAKLRAAVYSN
jgi:N-acetylglucosamine-6-sulfatase